MSQNRVGTSIFMIVALAVLLNTGTLAAQLTQPLDDFVDAFKWRSIGPVNTSGRVTDVEGIPFPSKTFYVATGASGLWKTTNNGTTFKSIFNEERVVAMGDLAIAPSDTNQIWLGTGEEDSRNSISAGRGIYKSTDGGETWELKGLEATQVIGRIVVHPNNPDIVYVAALGHVWDSNPERGLYRTQDGGETWELVKFISDSAGFVDVILHPEDPNVIFAASWQRVRGPYFLNSGGPGSALWKSTDGGDSWEEIVGNGFPTANKGRIGIAIALSNPRVMYTMVEAEEEEDGSGGSGLYRSDDGGVTWEKRHDANTRPFYYSQVRVDPSDPDRVYWSSTPLQFSNDGGTTAGTTTNGIHVDHHAMWIDPLDPERMVVGNDGGVAVTFDRGGNWITFNNVATGQFYYVSYNMDVPYRVCGGLQDNGLWCGPSRLADGMLNKYHWADVHFGDGFVSQQDPIDHDLIWTESQGGAMARQNLATGDRTTLYKPSWRGVWVPYQDTIVTLLEEGVSEDDPRIQSLRERASADSARMHLRWNWNTPFFQSVHERSHFYAGANMVLKSTEWGDSLQPISPDLTYADPDKVRISLYETGGITLDVTTAETYATIVSLAESPIQQGLIYAGTDDGRLWKTSNDGGDWTELTDRVQEVPAGTYVSRIAPSHHDANRFYVTYDNHRVNDFTPYVFATDDGGTSFRSIVANLPTGATDYVHVIVEDPHNENLLFVGTDLAVYVSTDRGGSWTRFMNGLPTVPVHDLKIHPRDHELIAGTHGRAIWIVNIAPLEQLDDQILADGAHLFETPTAYQFGQRARGGESYGQAWFARPTPGSKAAISYYINDETARAIREAARAERQEGERPSIPRASITITNSAGETVRTLSGRAAAGLHTVEWDLRVERSEEEAASPYWRAERVRVAERAMVVRDSMIAEGHNEMAINRLTGLFTGETDLMEMVRAMMMGQQGGDPEVFRERPGESMGGGMGMEMMGLAQDVGLAVMPELTGLGGLIDFFGSAATPAPLAEPGTYTLTLTIGDRTITQQIQVERVPGFEGKNSMF